MLSLPSLAGAEIVDIALQHSTLTLWLENVRWLDIVLAGPLNLEGICRARTCLGRALPALPGPKATLLRASPHPHFRAAL